MNKAIKLVMTGLLVSANMLAQETDSIQQYGRGISVDYYCGRNGDSRAIIP
jgi:hypothetical protein